MLMGSYNSGNLVLVKATSMLHPGVGRSGEVVDLPIQRDNLSFPVVYSSSLKGALKSAFWSEDEENAKAIFGPDPSEGDKHPSAILISDAFTLTFPVRSLMGVYAFITAPVLLKRLKESISVIEATGKLNEKIKSLKTSVKNVLEVFESKIKGKQEALVSTSSLLQVTPLGGDIVVNEEFRLKPVTDDHVKALEDHLGIERGRLIVAADDIAKEAIDRGLPKITRIKLERGSKTVSKGGLWTEEYIPQWTVFQTIFLYSKPHRNGKITDAEGVKEKVTEYLEKKGGYLIIGGNETIGRGIVRLEIIK